VRKPAGQQGFAVIPRRWAVERTLAWLTAHRRLARDYERDPVVSEAMIRWAAIATMTRGRPAIRQQRRTFPATNDGWELSRSCVAAVALTATGLARDGRDAVGRGFLKFIPGVGWVLTIGGVTTTVVGCR
jgi:hypothetical protein